ncbi:MAG TPA: winged helix-turn-helix domain-containing protein [Ktedonobacteraceae bacterium]|nr:winged helix-turn-helix domain-containing protein [Ktedonobacteraceae bacterium]
MQSKDNVDGIPVLPGNVPVTMPELPLHIVINTAQQFKAISDPIRSRILGIIQNKPATAKQVADILGASPGAIGHHLHVLEAAGLAQLVARRLVRGIVANYYTRTARIFKYDLPREVTGDSSINLNIIAKAYEELAEAEANIKEDVNQCAGFPHVRLSSERVKYFSERLQSLVDEVLSEAPDPNGKVYGILVSMFMAPDYIQGPAVILPLESTDPD